VALLLGGCLLSLRWVRVNIEPSVPVGVYLLHTARAPLTRGTLVLLPRAGACAAVEIVVDATP
jgi:type IV secretory pathway protease TraF